MPRSYTRYEYPDNETLNAAITKNGLKAVAQAIEIPEATLHAHCAKQGIATSSKPRKLSDEALVRLAGMV